MDLVVLCNVLHEIPVDKWLPAFRDIASVLDERGTLLLMEDQHMSIGELPTAHGFVVLDVIEVAALFGATLGMSSDERLTQIEISASVLGNANPARLKSALDQVQKRARREVERLRDAGSRSFQAGRRHAYFSMLYMNATLAQQAFG